MHARWFVWMLASAASVALDGGVARGDVATSGRAPGTPDLPAAPRASSSAVPRRRFPCRDCVYVPATRRPAPLLVVLHGDWQSARAIADVWAPATRARDVALLSLACPVDLGCPGSYWRWNGHPRWLDAQVQAVVDEAPGTIDESRVWLTAWSGGASYLGASARELSNRWAAVVLVGGGMPPLHGRCPARHPPVRFLVGDANPLHELARDLRSYYETCAISVHWDVRRRADHAGEMRALVASRDELLGWLDAHSPARGAPGASTHDASAPLADGATDSLVTASGTTAGPEGAVGVRNDAAADLTDTAWATARSAVPDPSPQVEPVRAAPRRGCSCGLATEASPHRGSWTVAAMLVGLIHRAMARRSFARRRRTGQPPCPRPGLPASTANSMGGQSTI